MTIIGHRGARGLAPENTLASLQIALRHHVQELEFDVRVSSDGVPVLHHDPAIRDTSGSYVIKQSRLQTLRDHKPDLITLSELLTALKPGMATLMIEVKPGEELNPIVNALQYALSDGWKPSDFMLASFSQLTLRELHQALPNIQKVVIERWSGLRAILRARQLETTRINMNQRWLWFGFIRAMHRHGYQLAAYTLNDPAKAHRWQRHGLYGVITDFPDYFEK